MAVAFHLQDALVVLGLLAFFVVLVSHISDLCIAADQLVSYVDLRASCDAATIEMLVNVNAALAKIELCFPDLLLGRQLRVESEPLCHLAHD